ncbi:cofF [Symbiodinium sp. CCMP2592]|nr:cofF [Symbiodinium sp. CCMP2592]
MVAVVFPMAPPFGWIEFNRGKRVVHQEFFRELFLQTFPAAGVARPHLIDDAVDTIPDTRLIVNDRNFDGEHYSLMTNNCNHWLVFFLRNEHIPADIYKQPQLAQ